MGLAFYFVFFLLPRARGRWHAELCTHSNQPDELSCDNWTIETKDQSTKTVEEEWTMPDVPGHISSMLMASAAAVALLPVGTIDGVRYRVDFGVWRRDVSIVPVTSFSSFSRLLFISLTGDCRRKTVWNWTAVWFPICSVETRTKATTTTTQIPVPSHLLPLPSYRNSDTGAWSLSTTSPSCLPRSIVRRVLPQLATHLTLIGPPPQDLVSHLPFSSSESAQVHLGMNLYYCRSKSVCTISRLKSRH